MEVIQMKVFWLYLYIAIIAITLTLSGCGGGGGGSSASENGGTDTPPVLPPIDPPIAPLTVKGTVVFNANTVEPMVSLAVLNNEGNFITIGKALRIEAIEGSEEVQKTFSLELSDDFSSEQIYIISFSDINNNGSFEQIELTGECQYRLARTAVRKWQVEDAFRQAPSWGVDATICSYDQLLVELIL